MNKGFKSLHFCYLSILVGTCCLLMYAAPFTLVFPVRYSKTLYELSVNNNIILYSLLVLELQKQVENLQKKLRETQERRKRQEELIMKVENVALKVRRKPRCIYMIFVSNIRSVLTIFVFICIFSDSSASSA